MTHTVPVPIRAVRAMVAGSLAIAVLGVTRPAQAESVTPPSACAALRGVSLPDATITAARAYSAGEFELPENGGSAWPPGMGPGNDAPSPMPAMCRVSLTLRPSEDSDIRMEAWLPLAGWNGKFVGVANFGTGGSIQYQSMVQPLQAGYALAANDTGHTGGGADFAVGHPQKMIDYAYRADHEMTLRARELVEKFYGRVPSRSIWVGCSLGGLQGLIEAKRYPGDYDGIVAGAPPNPLPLFNAQQLWGAWLNQRHPEGTIPAAKFAVVHQAALRACATPVGIAQGFIEDPEHCHFDPGTLLCKAGDTPDCLTASQVQRMRELYAGPLDPRTHKVMFPGPAVGAENELVMGATEPMRAAVDLYRFMVYQDPHWDWKTLDYTASVARAQREVGPLLTVDADLNAFLQRGHKLMIYVGWTEGHNGNDLVNYYREVVRAAGPAAAGNVRLFLVPGMNHCGGGAGCDTFDRVGVVDQWLQTGSAPDQILSSKESAGKVVRTRPLCAWPAIARYRGTGSMDEAASFECARPAGT